MCAGTLLGDVRDVGLIPWDNDGDLCVPRGTIDRLYHWLLPLGRGAEPRAVQSAQSDRRPLTSRAGICLVQCPCPDTLSDVHTLYICFMGYCPDTPHCGPMGSARNATDQLLAFLCAPGLVQDVEQTYTRTHIHQGPLNGRCPCHVTMHWCTCMKPHRKSLTYIGNYYLHRKYIGNYYLPRYLRVHKKCGASAPAIFENCTLVQSGHAIKGAAIA